MTRNHHQKAGLGLVLVCLLIGAAFGSLLWAPKAQAVLPPRPTVGPGDRSRAAPTPVPVVGQIRLHVTPRQGRYWSVVQWQDEQGTWHDVGGWTGAVTTGSIMWWVEEKDFGKGPFRWAVYQEGGPVVHRAGGSFLYLLT